MTRERGVGRQNSGGTGGWKASLAAVLKAHNGARHDGAVASFATRDKRADVLYAGFKQLHALGFRMDAVTSQRGKHIEALAKDWHARGSSASTLHNNLSIFRTFGEWIGKAGMVRGIEHYLGTGTAARSSIASQDRTWSGRDIDVAAKIEQVRQKDERVALQLQLQLALGLRAPEAMQLRAPTRGRISTSLTARRAGVVEPSRSARRSSAHCSTTQRPFARHDPQIPDHSRAGCRLGL